MARWHAEHYMMRVERQMQVSDITHSVLTFNISGGCSRHANSHALGVSLTLWLVISRSHA